MPHAGAAPMHREISHADDAFQQESRLAVPADRPARPADRRRPLAASSPAGWRRGAVSADLVQRNRTATASPCSPPSSAARASCTARSTACSRAASAPTWPWPSPASPPSSSASRSSPPRSSSSACSASAWKASPSSAPSGAIRQIVEVCPRRCWLLRDGQEERVLASELQVGDASSSSRAAGCRRTASCVDGRSAVDVSALTGESLPVDKGPGDEVLAGSLNQFGALTIEARRVAEQTVVGRVIELTARALKDKAAARAHRRPAGPLLPARCAGAGGAHVPRRRCSSTVTGWFRPPDGAR